MRKANSLSGGRQQKEATKQMKSKLLMIEFFSSLLQTFARQTARKPIMTIMIKNNINQRKEADSTY